MRLTLIQHLEELRKRVMIIAITMIVGALISYQYIDVLIKVITKPASQLDFIYLSPPELFLAYIKISLVVGIVVTLPITLFQIWLFIKPGLTKKERRNLLITLFMAIIFFLLGIVFAYFVIIPITIQFFVRMSTQQIEPLFSFANYITFISSLLLSFGLTFEMPLLILLLTQLNLVTISTLKKSRKFLILAIFIVAAILTPPDIISQGLMAAPMLLLFEFSLVISSMIHRKKQKTKSVEAGRMS
ncbi:twin-arginine translocase subunit TatC [Alkaliphilus transvaalensis]|uniref:twin-arginine translocase subunit TatC n=1 Tax=Alkaliphilus transvaalensis TaxID=114628 RepID=UPI00055215C2|nr:twin-arginine translocase subunit TatC [Alkaliphilus transvaalensis]